MKKNKIPLIALVSSFLFGIFGGTLAFYSSSSSFTNEYQAGMFKTKTTEDITLPSPWTNDQELSLGLTTKNEGTIPVAVRVSYGISSNVTDPLELTFSNEGRWIKEGNYYYYRYVVNQNEITKSLVSSIKNTSNYSLACNTVQATFKTTCYGTQNVAIQFNVETVDIEKYKDEWNTNVDIKEYSNPFTTRNFQNPGTITVGDYFKIENEEFYVVSSDANETVLLAANNLNVGSNTFSGCTQGLQCAAMINQSSKGAMAFSSTDYWTGQIGNGLKYGGTASACGPQASSIQPFTCYAGAYVYDDNSNLYTYIEQYKQLLINKGVTVKSARLMNDVEGESVEDYSWANNTKYWLGNARLDNNGLQNDGVSTTTRNIYIDVMNGTTDSYMYNDGVNYGVRPVIIVSTSDLLE